MKIKTEHTKPIGHYESIAKRKVHSTKYPIKENRESIYWRLNSTHESSRKKKKLIHPGGLEEWK